MPVWRVGIVGACKAGAGMSAPLWMNEEWKADSLKWRGEVLKGRFAHWCNEWDGLPVDETTEEFDCCGCDWGDENAAAKAAQASLREKLRADTRARHSEVCSLLAKALPHVERRALDYPDSNVNTPAIRGLIVSIRECLSEQPRAATSSPPDPSTEIR